jgi:hypothetical protein
LSLKEMSRKPKVGDFIYFEVEQQLNGKNRAINCRIEGVASKALKRKKHHVIKKSSAPKSKTILLFAVIAICAFAYQRVDLKPQHIPAQHYTTSKIEAAPPRPVTKPKSRFSCDGRQHYSQMNSYEEAKFFIQNCPNTKMDGDRGGVPCEQKFGRYDYISSSFHAHTQKLYFE